MILNILFFKDGQNHDKSILVIRSPTFAYTAQGIADVEAKRHEKSEAHFQWIGS